MVMTHRQLASFVQSQPATFRAVNCGSPRGTRVATLHPTFYGQGPCTLIVSRKSSPSERKGGVVPSIAFRNTSRSDCCAPVSVVAEVFPLHGLGPQGAIFPPVTT